MLEYLISKDQELLVFLNNLGSPQWDGFWLFMTSKITTAFLYIALLGLFLKKYGWKKAVFVLLFAVILIAISDQLSNLFKCNLARLRPCHEENVYSLIRIVKNNCGGKFSCFSAHASTGMALAIYFGLLLKSVSKYIKYILLIFAVFVGGSRVYLAVHYPLDVLIGFVIGLFLGFCMYKILIFVLQKRLI